MKNNKVVFCLGAGASKDAGIPTFRDGLSGYWRNYDPHKIASLSALELDPVEVNKFYNERRTLLARVEPTIFHISLKYMQEKLSKERVKILTTNVDDLLERTNLSNVHKIHGNLREIVTFEGEVIDIGYKELIGEDLKSCRPNVVLFGEGAYRNKKGELFNPYQEVEKSIAGLKKGDVVVIVGASSSVVDFPEIVSYNENNIDIIEVNSDKLYKSKKQNHKVLNDSIINVVYELEDMLLSLLES